LPSFKVPNKIKPRDFLAIFGKYKPIGAMPQRHFFRGEGGVWYEKGVTLHGLRMSEKKEILRKLTVL
jgi:hypothetical protein